MASWKRVLTEEDLSGTSPNLATSDLTQSATQRVYTLPTSASSSSLRFDGTAGSGGTRTFLRIECDSDQDEITQNYVYVNSLRIGNFEATLDGTINDYGYHMPLYDDTVDAGKFIVSFNSWSGGNGFTKFEAIDEILKPGGEGLFHPDDDANNTGAGVTISPTQDSVLMYDDNLNKFVHVTVAQITATAPDLNSKRTTLLFGRNESQSGTFFLKGLNGVQHTASSGYAATRDCTIVGGSLYYKKGSTTSTSTSKRVQVYVDGILKTPFGSAYVGDGSSANSHVTKGYDEGDIQNTVNISKGDTISVRISGNGSGTTSASAYQVVLELE